LIPAPLSVRLTRYNRPLAAAVATAQDTLPGLDPTDDSDEADHACDNGACFT
jgi:hypothetical protein